MLDLESLFKLSYLMCILCSKKKGKINGCIVNTIFQTVSEPPMIDLSINKESLTYEYITNGKIITVSVLPEGTPIKFIGGFGFSTGRDIDKFQQVRYISGQNGVTSILDNEASYIEADVL
jgi:ferric-chelate reductase [NAD(P)H]